MSSTLNVGHGNFVAENPLMNYSGGRDLEIMGAYGCSVSHCPVNIARGRGFSIPGSATARLASTSRSAPTPIRAT